MRKTTNPHRRNNHEDRTVTITFYSADLTPVPVGEQRRRQEMRIPGLSISWMPVRALTDKSPAHAK